MKRLIILLALALAACEGKVDVKAHVEQKPAEEKKAPPKLSDDERLARARKRGEEFFSSMQLAGTPSCYLSEKDAPMCQLPEPSKRRVHVIDCNTDGCNYRGFTEF